MAFTTNQTTVAELSQAAYGRVLANTGLDFYADHLTAGTMTAATIMEQFMTNTEATVRYPTTATDAETVTQVFNNVLGRTPAQTGIDFYSDLLANGTVTKTTLVSMILADAKGLSGGDATYINDAVAAGEVVYDATVAAELAAANATDPVALTTAADTLFGDAYNNTFTATADGANGGTYNSADIIADSVTTDSDTLTIASTAAIIETATVVGIENVTINQTSFAEAEAALTGIAASSVTINQLQAGAVATAAITGATGTLTFGTGITSTTTVGQTAASNLTVNVGNATTTVVTGGTTGTLTVNAGASTTAITGAATTGSVTLNGGAATTNATSTAVTTGTSTITGAALATVVSIGATQNVTTAADASTISLTGTAATTDTATVSIGAASTISNQAVNVETVNISTGTTQTAASVATFDTTAATTYNLTGANSITLSGLVAMFDGKTVTDATTAGTATLQLTTAGDISGDYTLATVDNLNIAGIATASTIEVAAGQNITTSAINTGDITFSIDNGDTTYTDGGITINLGVAHGANAGITVAANSATADNITALTINNNTVAQANLELIATATAAVTMTGSKAVTLEADSTALSLDASAMTAAANVTVDGTADIVTITTGSGNDTLTATAAASAATTVDAGAGNDTLTASTLADVTYDGGAGTDTANVETDMSDLTLSNVEILNLTGDVTVARAAQFDGTTYVVTTDNGTETVTFGTGTDLDSATIDLSGLTIDDLVSFTVDASGGLSTNLYAATQALTFTGSSVVDDVTGTDNADTISTGAGADIIVGGAGVDTITAGEGIDTITGGAGNDIINLTETTAVADIVIFSVIATNGQDAISGFEATDTFNVALLGDGTIAQGATAITSAATIRTLVDDDSVVITTNGAAADITTSGTATVSDFTNATQIAAYLTEAVETAVGAATEGHVFIINDENSDNTYFWSFDSDAADQTISAAELTLVGIVDNGGVDLVDANIIYA